jgi:hypothetical protein
LGAVSRECPRNRTPQSNAGATSDDARQAISRAAAILGNPSPATCRKRKPFDEPGSIEKQKRARGVKAFIFKIGHYEPMRIRVSLEARAEHLSDDTLGAIASDQDLCTKGDLLIVVP